MFWFRRRLPASHGSALVALSLGTRDPAQAGRLARLLACKVDRMISTPSFGPSPTAVTNGLKAFLALRAEDALDEALSDVRAFANARAADAIDSNDAKCRPGSCQSGSALSERRYELWNSQRHTLIFAALYAAAADFGPSGRDARLIDAHLDRMGVVGADREIAHRRWERGFAAEVYRGNSTVSGAPSDALLDETLIASGRCPSPDLRERHRRAFSAEMARILRETADLRARGLEAPEAVLGSYGVPLPSAQLPSGHVLDEPPSGSARAFQRGHPGDVLSASSRHDDASPNSGSSGSINHGAPPNAEAAAPETANDNGEIRVGACAAWPAIRTVGHEGDLIVAPRNGGAGVGGSAGSSTVALPAPTIVDIANEWNRSGLNGPASKTISQYVALAKMLVYVLGRDDLSVLGADAIRHFFLVLGKLKRTFGKSAHDFQQPLDEVLAKCALLPADAVGRNWQTRNRYVSQIGQLCAQARLHNASTITKDELKGLRVPKRKSAKRDAIWTTEQLQWFFGQPTWMTPNEKRPALYWVPLLAVFTGARRGELCGLRPCEVDVERNAIRLVANENRRLKTAFSERDLPLHPELIRLGFLDYVKARQAAGGDLFPELRQAAPGTPHGDTFYKLFSKALKACSPSQRQTHARLSVDDVRAWSDLDFHGIRHWFITKLTNEGVDFVVRARLLGHEVGNIHGDTYTHDIWKAQRAANEALLVLTAHLSPAECWTGHTPPSSVPASIDNLERRGRGLATTSRGKRIRTPRA